MMNNPQFLAQLLCRTVLSVVVDFDIEDHSRCHLKYPSKGHLFEFVLLGIVVVLCINNRLEVVCFDNNLNLNWCIVVVVAC